MSLLKVTSLAGPGITNKTVSVIGGAIDRPGRIIQVRTVRSDFKTTYSAPNSGNGTPVAQLNIGIFPKFATSWILVQWMLCGEMQNDCVWLIHRDGSVITDAGYEGYNNSYGNTARWVGYVPAGYDADDNSTPHNYFIQWYGPANSTVPRIYTPAVRSSSSGNYTWALNRTLGSAGQDGFENMISTGVIMEIAA